MNQTSEDESPFNPDESYGIQFLAKELAKKLDLADMTPDVENITLGCKGIRHVEPDECNRTSLGKSCLQPILPADYETRIKQLAFKDNLQIDDQYTAVIKSFTDQINGSYDVIIVSAVSSNHFKESQALLNSLHTGVFPLLTDYLLVVFDIGLSVEEKIQYKKYCRCIVIDFLFEKFPPHFKSLKCFAWKPIAVSAVYPKANVVIWADASVRFVLPEAIPAMVSKTKRQGVAIRCNPKYFANPYYTLKQMFQYFGDSPCAHLPFVEVEMAFGMFHREPLVKKTILDPWVGCALNAACTCPVPQHTVQFCPPRIQPPRFGYCMRLRGFCVYEASVFTGLRGFCVYRFTRLLCLQVYEASVFSVDEASVFTGLRGFCV
ncbi:uncharacterized protein LOC131939952 [Physella acuta]|uniref:uncharacterized protein LOC131939952 n=1 Tax=Physella acuta TaxID=109671 RepID=UPI0027DE9BA7|nr:uncharacterized protein LOC131939952 [Physella acuta]